MDGFGDVEPVLAKERLSSDQRNLADTYLCELFDKIEGLRRR